MNRLHRALGLLLVLLLGACIAGGDPADPADRGDDGGVQGGAVPAGPGSGQAGLADPEVQRDDCPTTVTAALEQAAAEAAEAADQGEEPRPAPASCGYLIAPEDRDSPAGPVVEVAYARLPARPTESPPTRRPPPLLVLPDGPGVGGVDEVAAWATSRIRDEREVLLIDPRGTGRSFPALDCGEVDRPGAPPLDLVADCRRDLAAQGVDVRAYATAAIAADVGDLVRALDLDRVDVLGVGAGARVALEVLRQGRVAVRALVLDSTAPPDIDLIAVGPATAEDALDRLVGACAERDRCAEDLLLTAGTALGELPQGAAAELAAAVVAAMRGRDGPLDVVDALQHLADGEPESAAAALGLAEAGGADPAVSEGAALAVRCPGVVEADAPPEDAARTGFGRAIVDQLGQLLQACAAWPVGPPDPGSAEVVRTGEVFVLALTGELDPLVPPRHADRLVDGDRAQSIVLPDIGHRVHDADACTTDLVVAFLLRPGASVDASCAAVQG